MIVSVGDVLLQSESDYLGLSVRVGDRLSAFPGGYWHETAEITTGRGIRDLLRLTAESNVLTRLSENDTVLLCVGVYDAANNTPQGPWLKAYDHLVASMQKRGCDKLVVVIPPKQKSPYGTSASRRWLRRAATHIKETAKTLGVQVVDPSDSPAFTPDAWESEYALTSQGYIDLAVEVANNIAPDNIKTASQPSVAPVPKPSHGVTITLPADRKRWRGA